MKVPSLMIWVLVLVPAGLAVAGSGCTSSRVVRCDDLRAGDVFARSVVFLQGGARYEFLRVAVYPDTVVGEYRITVERSSRAGGTADQAAVYYEDEIHAHRMALARVDSVAVLRRDPVKTLLYATGAAGVGFLMVRAIDSGSFGKDGTSNPKSAGPPP
jgi:hypothetical protein